MFYAGEKIMKMTPDFLNQVEQFAEDELLEFMVLYCQNKEIPMFISEAILVAIENARNRS